MVYISSSKGVGDLNLQLVWMTGRSSINHINFWKEAIETKTGSYRLNDAPGSADESSLTGTREEESYSL